MKEIFNINSEARFSELALRVFHYQYNNNPVYKNWVNFLKTDPAGVGDVEQIPFLPIEVFKNEQVLSSPLTESTLTFKSSSTTSQQPSVHYVNDAHIYRQSFSLGFERFYGSPADYCILALLPGYLERKDSSLVYMVKHLIEASGHSQGGFFLNDTDGLLKVIESLKEKRQKTLVIGVSYALMDLCEKVKLSEDFTVIETGGMKGKRKELLKPELHALLKKGFGVKSIHSEYGMTELLSQAYSEADGLFKTPPWMKFLIREITDPLQIRHDHKTGGINVIDLANILSCSFIATKDLGRMEEDGLVLMGRFDESDVRGCNLMVGG